MRNSIRLDFRLLAVALLAALAVLAAACYEGDKKNTDTIDIRWERNGRAIEKWGIPETVNFPYYGVLYDMTVRTDMVNHPWYLYVITELGTYTGYYVATTPPVNACNFVSSTQDVRDDDDGNLILTAPSLDGIFYGGAGSEGSCDAWVFFDYNTGAMVWTREKMRASDAPFVLANDVPRLQVNTNPPDVGPQAPETLPNDSG